MAASVQELIALAEHESRVKNPGASAVQSLLQGFGQAQHGGLDRTLKLMQMDQMRREQEYQAKRQAQLYEGQRDGMIWSAHGSLREPGTSPLPGPRLKQKTSVDAKGYVSDTYEVVEPKEVSYQKAEYLDSKGETRIGRFNPTTGKIEQSPDDMRAPKSVAETNAINGKMLPANTVLALNEGKNVARLLPEVEAAIQQNLGEFGPVTGLARGLNPYDETAQTFDAQMRSASQSFGKFMEGGVLRKEDEEKYRKMFPQSKDTDGVKTNKLSIIRKMLAEKYEDDRKTLGASGYDVSGFEELSIPESIFGKNGGDTSSGPKPGDVEDGYRFRGGDPSNPNNWEKT